jgi:hypothetical protein
MSIVTTTPEACYLTKQNIQHPGTSTQATAAEATARLEIAARLGITTVSGGTIKQGR